MRRIHRVELSLSQRQALFNRSRRVVAGEQPRAEWKRFRGTRSGRDVAQVLVRMAGSRNRCFYCGDSLGADVEHYYPVASYPEKTFAWLNLLWMCPTCNRAKGDRFPVGSGDEPLVIDPTRCDPWEHLILDTRTGVIAARYLPDGFDAVGEATLAVVPTINFEWTIEGRSRTIRRVREAVTRFLADPTGDARANLLTEVAEDEFGVANWFGKWEGSQEAPFSALRSEHVRPWRRFVIAASRQ